MIAAVGEDREHLIGEAADLLYHLLVLLQARGIKLAEVEALLETRTKKSGLEEKASRKRLRPTTSMEQRIDDGLSPYRTYSRGGMGGAARRHADDADAGRGDAAALAARPARHEGGRGDLSAAVAAALALRRGDAAAVHARSSASSAREDDKMPYIIGVAGSVAVGKSTTARVLQALLARWPNVPKVDLVTTDGFLLPNAVLRARRPDGEEGLSGELRPAGAAALPLRREGGPPSGARADLLASRSMTWCRTSGSRSTGPDILIVEGLNVLQTGRLPKDGKAIPFVSDFFDFSVYLDADEDVLQQLVRRPLSHAARHRVPRSEILLPSLFEADRRARRSRPRPRSGTRINLVNLHENILPTRQRADLILKKGESHLVEEVALRKL